MIFEGAKTDGAPKTVAVDDDGKLLVEGSISLDASDINIGNVDIATLPAVHNALGLVEATPPLDTNIYASGDVLFIPVALSFASANGGRGLLHSVVIIDKDDQGQALDLVFLRDTTTTFGTINGAVGIDDTDAGQILGIVSISSSDFIDLGGCKIATLPNIGLTLRAASGGTGCYVAGISRGTGTYTGTGLVLKFGIAALD